MTDNAAPEINLRNAALTLLLDTEKGGKSHLLLKEYLDRHSMLDKQKRAFLTRLYQGTLEREIELDYMINQFSKIKTAKMKPVIRQILRMSVYQIKYMDAVPDFAVCNEAVRLVQKRNLTNLKGFVNGVLRTIIKNKENVRYPEDEIKRLSIQYSVPEWIIQLWNNDYGKETAERILSGLCRSSFTTVRCNKSKSDVASVMKSLKREGVTVERTIYPTVLQISGYDTLEKLESFRNGEITVQDLSSVFAGVAANPKENDYIIDVCAAPGGKSICMADFMNRTGMVEARDLTPQKTALIEENIKRIGFSNIRTKVQDATVLDEASIGQADIVMADLPCSGLGVLGKKSDIRYRMTPEQIKELVELQRRILSVVSRYVKPEGTLIFSTCTVDRQENDENAAWILENLPFCKKSLKEVLPKELPVLENQVQIFPGDYGMHGFFIAAFTRQ